MDFASPYPSYHSELSKSDVNSCLGYVCKVKDSIASIQLRSLNDHEIESLKQGMNRCLFFYVGCHS